MPLVNGYAWISTTPFPHPARTEPRRYELIPAGDADPGHFIMDEKSGLLLDSYLDGSSLFSAFYISGKLYHFTYELAQDRIAMRSPFYQEETIRATCYRGSTSLCVKSLRLLGMQACNLTRKP